MNYAQKKVYEHIGRSIKSDIGIELEIEGRRLPTTIAKYWTPTTDNSIRGGFEYVLAQPIKFNRVEAAVDHLVGRFKDVGAEIIPSNRCSTHIHLNFSQDTLEDVAQFMTLYWMVEEALIESIGEDRPGNLFCFPSYDSAAILWTFERAIDQRNLNHLADNNIRYSSMNLNALPRYGSIEFRFFRGVHSIDDLKESVVLWSNVLNEIKTCALKNFKTPSDIVNEFSALSPDGFLSQHLPLTSKYIKDSLAKVGLIDQLDNMLWNGMRVAQDIAFLKEWRSKEKGKEEEDVAIVDELTRQQEEEGGLVAAQGPRQRTVRFRPPPLTADAARRNLTHAQFRGFAETTAATHTTFEID